MQSVRAAAVPPPSPSYRREKRKCTFAGRPGCKTNLKGCVGEGCGRATRPRSACSDAVEEGVGGREGGSNLCVFVCARARACVRACVREGCKCM